MLESAAAVRSLCTPDVAQAANRYDRAALEKGKDDDRFPGKDRRYAAVDSCDLPLTESLKQTIDRVLPYWRSNVLPAVQAGKRCIIVGHGNSIRVSQIGVS